MTMSLATHQFGKENSTIMDAMAESAGRGESLEDFKKHFGVYRIEVSRRSKEFKQCTACYCTA